MNRPAAVVISLIILVAAAVLLRNLSGGGDGTGAVQASPAVKVYPASSREIAYRTEALGTLRARESVDITSRTSEAVASVHFGDGQRVQQGDTLVVLVQEEEQAQLSEARSELAEQERELRRIEGLVKARSLPQSELDQRRTQLDKAQARIREIEARLDRLVIRAPFDGVLGLRQISPGALVTPGTLITTLDDISSLKLDFHVPEILLGSIAVGQQIEARNPGFDEHFPGRVTALDGRVNPVDRSIVVRAELPNPERRLRPGLLMNVQLLREPRRALLIPEESLVARQADHFVWVVDLESRTVSERPVQIRWRQPGWVEISAGLEESEWVVREGVSSLRNGIGVRIINTELVDQAVGAG